MQGPLVIGLPEIGELLPPLLCLRAPFMVLLTLLGPLPHPSMCVSRIPLSSVVKFVLLDPRLHIKYVCCAGVCRAVFVLAANAGNAATPPPDFLGQVHRAGWAFRLSY